MKRRNLFPVCALAFALSSTSLSLLACSGSRNRTEAQADTTRNTQVAHELETLAFPLPDVPSYLIEPHDRAKYLLLHYWDNCSFTDTTELQKGGRMEASFANFAALAANMPLAEIQQSLLVPLEKSSGKMLNFFLKMYEKYYYFSNSPMHNEEFYIPILDWAEQSPKLDFASQERLKARAKLVRRNRVGSKAFDFALEMADGSQRKLHSFAGEYLLLIFYSPGCHTCQMTIEQINNTPEIGRLHTSKRVRSLYVYAENDKEAWLNYRSQLPSYACNGMNTDGAILSRELYDLKASPTIYLLDKEKKVLLKDVSIETVLDYLNFHL
ncbi:DUF5106 domain-containing protein [Porphyromonas crevioricanis]|uniref:DUF5106 domain-containing protein n=1 Tax=Porphyromonas crevioricanis TaxID=393921 RepID=A0AB34PHV0_9PORP|nr:DUF5106 domain-containing protein [Porphyromonas crevioricanis]KGN93033.1 hypothetical protein HQ38_09710 [Porphyromonas crevioricanis]